MSLPLPPPPRNVTDTREMYTWLYRLYAYVSGSAGGVEVSGDAVVMSSNSTASQIAEQQKTSQGLALSASPTGGEYAKDLEGAILLASPPATRSTVESWQRHFMTMGG